MTRKVLPQGLKQQRNGSLFEMWIDGLIYKFKVCLMAKGFTRSEGIDYEETFSHVTFASIRLLLALVAHLDFELFQMDI